MISFIIHAAVVLNEACNTDAWLLRPLGVAPPFVAHARTGDQTVIYKLNLLSLYETFEAVVHALSPK